MGTGTEAAMLELLSLSLMFLAGMGTVVSGAILINQYHDYRRSRRSRYGR